MTTQATLATPTISIVIPAKNEAKGLFCLLPTIRSHYPDAEIIVVDDGSTDNTQDICKANHVICITHKYSKGNGAAIKTGARAATRDTLVLMDADGQHLSEDIPSLIERHNEGYDMVVGSRDRNAQASFARFIANTIYNKLASWITGHRVLDLTSGFRVANREKFLEFIHLLPNGFSYPTTSTMAFFRAGYSVCYVPVNVMRREGTSHINISKDGIRFLLIIFKVGTLYSPLKIFAPAAFMHFSAGIAYYIYTYLSSGRFTNMSALLFMASVFIFLIGLISEQITTLMYSKKT